MHAQNQQSTSKIAICYVFRFSGRKFLFGDGCRSIPTITALPKGLCFQHIFLSDIDHERIWQRETVDKKTRLVLPWYGYSPCASVQSLVSGGKFHRNCKFWAVVFVFQNTIETELQPAWNVDHELTQLTLDSRFLFPIEVIAYWKHSLKVDIMGFWASFCGDNVWAVWRPY